MILWPRSIKNCTADSLIGAKVYKAIGWNTFDPDNAASGRLPSLLKRPEGSFVTGILAEANARDLIMLKAWCLVIRLGAILQTKAWRPNPLVTHTDRYVRLRNPDQAVKPPTLELPHRQDGDHMKWLALLLLLLLLFFLAHQHKACRH